MPFQKGRDLLLKIGDGAGPEVFTAIGAARTVGLTLANRAVDATDMNAEGMQQVNALAGVQALQLRLDGLFRDAAAEELLRAAAFGQASVHYQLLFPNGDMYAAAFVVQEYSRGGSFEGLESFSVTLQRDGAGVFTPGA